MFSKRFEKAAFKTAVKENVKTLYRKTIDEATPQQLFQAVSYAVKDVIIDDWIETQKRYDETDAKTVYYMSMEFLMGRALGNNLINMTAYKDVKEALEIAKGIGFPVIVKAVLGGGGKGMRVAYNEDEFENAFLMAQKESGLAFGDESMYLEHFVENPRHIEFQILADNYGNVIHLGERDCSVQRNHQKVIEESPSAVVDEELREKMGQAAVLAAKAAGYKNAGTIEFLLEKDKSFYFMEMNTRIQVEHPVTEWVTGIDLIKAQIRIADGEKLKWKQEDIQITGHAIECRINAEDPSKNFRPCPGRITDMYLPGGKGVRIDSAIYSGCEVSPYYDSMITKLIVFAATRKEAIAKMHRALGEVIIEGITTNIDFLYEIMERPDYQEGDFTIQYLEKVLEERSQEIKK